jgi:hypothetical protein
MFSFCARRVFLLTCLTVLLILLVHLHTGPYHIPSESGDRCRLSCVSEEVQAGICESSCTEGSLFRPVHYTYIYIPANPADVKTTRGICGARTILSQFAKNRDKVQPSKYNLPYNGTGQSEFTRACDPVVSVMAGLSIAPRRGTAGVTGSAEADYNQTTKTLTTLRIGHDAMLFRIPLNSGTSPVQIERI